MIVLIALVAIVLPGDAFAQGRKGEAQAFGGFSFLYRSVGDPQGGEDAELQPGDIADSVSMYGIQGDLTYYVTDNVGVVIFGSYHRGNLDTPGLEDVRNLDVTQFLLLFGPRIQLGSSEKFHPAVHALIGLAQANVDRARIEGEEDEFLFLNENALAFSFGASFDVDINQSWSYRIVHPDVIISRFGDATQVNFSLATGIVGNF
jgi:hypothetical protein